MKQWFNNLKHHEQWMMLLASALLLAYMLYSLLWQPLNDSQELLERQNEQAAITLQTVKKLAAEYKRLSGGAEAGKSSATDSLASIVDKAVANNKLAMSRFQPSSSGDAQIRFENANFKNVLAWLYQMEVDYAVLVKDLSISKGSASGLVNVSVRVSKG